MVSVVASLAPIPGVRNAPVPLPVPTVTAPSSTAKRRTEKNQRDFTEEVLLLRTL